MTSISDSRAFHDAAPRNVIPFRDRVKVAVHEINVVAIIASDILENKAASEIDFDRLALSLERLRALAEVR